MDAHVVFAGVNINYIIEQINVKKSLNHRVTPYIGQDGSDISFVSSESKVLSFKSLCKHDEQSTNSADNHRIMDYIQLAETYAQKGAALTSLSKSGIDGTYIITGFDYTEDTQGNYEISWEFTEQVTFNVTQKTFRVWNKAQAKAGKKKTKSKLGSNTKYLLKNCGVMGRKLKIKGKNYEDVKGVKCVKCLQIYLQARGFYKNNKIDGRYGANTEKAVKGLQKKLKLKVTGIWDKQTIKYLQKRYKYPVDLIDASNKKLNKSSQWAYLSRKPITFSRKKG